MSRRRALAGSPVAEMTTLAARSTTRPNRPAAGARSGTPARRSTPAMVAARSAPSFHARDQDAAAAASSHRDHDEGAAVQVGEHAIHGPSADAEHQGQLGPRGPDQPGPGSELGQLSRLVEGQAAGGAGDPLGKAAHCRRIQTAG